MNITTIPQELLINHIYPTLSIFDITHFLQSSLEIKNSNDNDQHWKHILQIKYPEYHQYLLKYPDQLNKELIKELLYALYLRFDEHLKSVKAQDNNSIFFAEKEVCVEDKTIHVGAMLVRSCMHTLCSLNKFLINKIKPKKYFLSFSEACKINNPVIIENMIANLPCTISDQSSGNYCLYNAARFGHTALFMRLWELYSLDDLDKKSFRPMKPPKEKQAIISYYTRAEKQIRLFELIAVAAKGGSIDIVKKLFDSDIESWKISKVIEAASRYNHLLIMKFLLTKIVMKQKYFNELITNCFVEACGDGSYETAGYILEKYVDIIDFKTDHYYCIRGPCNNGHPKIVELLLSNKYKDKVDPRNEDSENSDALKAAVRNGHTEIVAMLLQDGRVNPIGENGNILKAACYTDTDTTDCMKLLLATNIVKRYMKKNGVYILEEAICNREIKIIELLLQVDMFFDPLVIGNELCSDRILHHNPAIGALIITNPNITLASKHIEQVIETLSEEWYGNVDYETPLHQILDYCVENSINITMNKDILKNVIEHNRITILKKFVAKFGLPLTKKIYKYVRLQHCGWECARYLLEKVGPSDDDKVLIWVGQSGNVKLTEILANDTRIPNNINNIDQAVIGGNHDCALIMLRSPTFTFDNKIDDHRLVLEWLKNRGIDDEISIGRTPQMWGYIDVLKELKELALF